jgi:hypothetical protein
MERLTFDNPCKDVTRVAGFFGFVGGLSCSSRNTGRVLLYGTLLTFKGSSTVERQAVNLADGGSIPSP